jgi:calcineurin-like phosphoesterase family protein
MIPSLYEPFKHWAEKGSVCILSDLHFDDADCKVMDRNWITPEEQITIINKNVFANDTFVCLGDVGDPKYIPKIKARKKILLLGNHDKKHLYTDVFTEIYDGPLFIAEKILLSHEPVSGLTWCLNIHGHDHSGIESYTPGCKHLNLAANVCGYTPVNLGKLIKDGALSNIKSIHRMTIDNQTEKKKKRKTSDN